MLSSKSKAQHFTPLVLFKMGLSLLLIIFLFNQDTISLASKPSLSDKKYMKTYLTGTNNVPAYSSTSTSNRIGSIYPTDEIYVDSLKSQWVHCSYPTTDSNRKNGYIKLSSITSDNLSDKSGVSRANIVTYKRASASSTYGFISTGDTVIAVAKSGNFTQVIYPSGNVYKQAWIKTTSYNTYIASSSGSQEPNNNSSDPTYCSPIQDPAAYFRSKTTDRGWYGYHDVNGVSLGTKVYAIANGTVTYQQYYRTYNGVKYLTSYGNIIKFKSSDTKTTAFYAHLNAFKGVTPKIATSHSKAISGSQGQLTVATKSVKKGEVIGYIGKTGNASGVHLHFELYLNGNRIDPVAYTDMKGK